ncbi:MAG: FesM [Anaerolineae bacterium]|nr:FesM [Anaerolineae bacterium]
MTGSTTPIYRPKPAFDLLRVPGLGRLLRWRWGRLVFQLPLAVVAAVMIYDGLTGPKLAPQNLATVAAWVHYRGLVVLALLLAGNLFCMSCPFTLPRTLARRLSGHGRRWPMALRNKWLAIALFVGLLFLYEALDLWASPWLTAWLIVAYFAAAFVFEALFAESPFCKYLCPIGTFNFVGSTISPLQITSRDTQVCRTCVGKECVNGSAQVLGCGTELFVPQMRSNMDCVLCLDCVRACPHDNVALAARKPLAELTIAAWPRRWDVALLALVFAFTALGNAFGMVPPVYALESALARWLGTTNETLILALIFGVIYVALPVLAGVGAAWLSQRLAGAGSLRVVLARYAPAVVPLGFAVWFAHYWFHFASGALTIIPVLQSFLIDHGVTLLGAEPNWRLGAILPADALFLLEMGSVLIGFIASLAVLRRIADNTHEDGRMATRAMAPWLALLALIAVLAVALFTLPMEMRGMMAG